MNKTKIDALIIVEGKTDIDFLSSFIEAEFIITNGSAVPRETINYISNAKKTKNVIVLTDPDFPGKRIRELLNNEIPGLYNAYIDKGVSIKKNKVGVAESTKEEILKALSNLELRNNVSKKGNITMGDLFNYSYCGTNNSKELRNAFSKEYNLGINNAKSFMSRLNNRGISIEELISFKNKYEQR